MVCASGDVIVIDDRWTRPPKHKIHICVCPTRQLFLRINTKNPFGTSMPLPKADFSFLHHDSFLEMTGLVRNHAYDIQQAGSPIATLSASQKAEILASVEAAKTLAEKWKRVVRETFGKP